MAPNLITLIGILFMFSGVLVWALADGQLTSSQPTWTYLYVAFAMFMYQTFDACDGKQARRTNSSSPLGQLFDHGCDAINSIIAAYFILHAWQLECDWKFFSILSIAPVSPFASECSDLTTLFAGCLLHCTMGRELHSRAPHQHLWSDWDH